MRKMRRFGRFLRTLLVLGRVSNLPTVWSNCLAGWWLGGRGNIDKLPYLFAGATCLYIGGMFLNDAFDAEFDRQYRKERPIPSHAIALKTVWVLGVAWLALGACCLAWIGAVTGAMGLALAGCIVLYDAVHKRVNFAPVLMGLCRFVLYLAAISSAVNGWNARGICCGVAIFAYIIGLSYVARRESRPGPLRYWPVLLLVAPVVIALVFNGTTHLESALLLTVIFGLWTIKSLRYTLWTEERNIGQTVAGLLAGIVLVDWLAAANAPREFGAAFVALFLAALLFQRFVPAT
jgi:heme O synthase-like polyprenyltransferase